MMPKGPAPSYVRRTCVSDEARRIAYTQIHDLCNTERLLDDGKYIRTFADIVDPYRHAKPQLAALYKFVRQGDIVVCQSMDHCARSLPELENFISRLTTRQVTVQFICELLTFPGTESATGTTMLEVVKSILRFDCGLASKVQNSRSENSAKGNRRAKPAKLLSPHQMAALTRRLLAGANKSALAEEFEVDRRTISRYEKRLAAKTTSRGLKCLWL